MKKNAPVNFLNRKKWDYYEYNVMDSVNQIKFLQPAILPEITNSLCHVLELGEFIAGPTFQTLRKNLPTYLIVYTISGIGTLQYKDTIYQINPGQVFWINCSELQHYYTDEKEGSWRHLWIHFNGESAKQYYNLFQKLNQNEAVITPPQSSSIETIMLNLLDLYNTNSNDILMDIQASSLLIDLMVGCISSSKMKDELSSIPPIISQARNYIRDHYHETINLDLISDAHHINKYHLLRQFKRYFGYTPMEYVIQLRLQKGKELLKTTNIPIYEIASQIGFFNTSHFINSFKKFESITPGAYRKMWLNNVYTASDTSHQHPKNQV